MPRGSGGVSCLSADVDTEDEDAFDTTLRFLAEQKAETAYFNILVPLRGTPLHDRFKAEGRLLDEGNMERWPELSCHFRPLRNSPKELVRRVTRNRQEFYTLLSAVQRLPFPYKESHFAAWNLHFLQEKVANSIDSIRDFTEF